MRLIIFSLYSIISFISIISNVNCQTTSNQDDQRYGCLRNWYYLSSLKNCYYFEAHDKRNFDYANTACADLSDGFAYLVVIDRVEENGFIVDLLKSAFYPHLNDIRAEWYTSGRRMKFDNGSFTRTIRWIGDGSKVGMDDVTYWLTERDKEGSADPHSYLKPDTVIYRYAWDGTNKWGWSMATNDVERNYICEMSVEDSALVRRLRTFDFGQTSTEPRFLGRGPRFVIQPSYAYYMERARTPYVYFDCVADGFPYPEYFWTKDTKDPTKKIVAGDNYLMINGKLMIFKPDADRHFGRYYCHAYNKYGTIISYYAELSKAFINDFPITERNPVRTTENSYAILPCTPPAFAPAVSTTWYKTDIYDPVKPETKPLTFISKSGTLYFEAVQRTDEANYFCNIELVGIKDATEAKNSQKIKLIVSTSGSGYKQLTMADGFPIVYPTSPKQHDDITIECVAFGTKITTYWWDRTDKRALPTDRSFTDTLNKNRTLHIRNLQFEDAGEYRCHAKNEVGDERFRAVKLTIQAIPYFIISLKNRHIDEGKTFRWRCEANGIPKPRYHWLKNGVQLKADGNHIVFLSDNIVEFRGVTQDDSGMYQCAANNTLRTSYSTAQLRVLSFKPTFEKYPMPPNIIATVQASVTIKCYVEGAPQPTITWKKDGNDLQFTGNPDEDDRYLLNDKSIYISKAAASDEGFYECVATNIIGGVTNEVRGRTYLSVVEETKIQTQPTDEIFKVNERVSLPCFAWTALKLDLTYSWTHNKRLIDFENETAIFGREYGPGKSGNLIIKDTSLANQGTYECIAGTPMDKNIASSHIKIVGPPGPPYGLTLDSVLSIGGERLVQIEFWEGAENQEKVLGFIVEGWKNVSFDEFRHLQTFYTNTSNLPDSTLRKVKHDRWQADILAKLNSAVDYKFRVIAFNVIGKSEPSRNTTTYTTGSTKPTNLVQNVTGGGGKIQTLVARWNPLPRSQWNDHDLWYEIEMKKTTDKGPNDWKRLSTKDDHYKKIHKVGEKTFIIAKNDYYIPYHIRVRPVNTEGVGNWTEPVVAYSAERLPSKRVTEIVCESYNATSIRVRWKEISDAREDTGGEILGYKIEYRKHIEGANTTYDRFRNKRQICWGKRDSCHLVGLEANTYYDVEVVAFNSAGNTPRSSLIPGTTLRSQPKMMPTEVHLYPHGANSVSVKWRGISTRFDEEPLQGYMIRYWIRGESMYQANNLDALKNTEIVVENLRQDIKYNLRIFGYSRGGEGKMSSPVMVFAIGSQCSLYEDDPEAEFQYICNEKDAYMVWEGAIINRMSWFYLTVCSLFSIQYYWWRHS